MTLEQEIQTLVDLVHKRQAYSDQLDKLNSVDVNLKFTVESEKITVNISPLVTPIPRCLYVCDHIVWNTFNKSSINVK